MDKLHLEIVTPDGLIFSNEVKSVVLPGSEGEFGVLPGHASLVSLLSAGLVDIESEDNAHDIVAINWGYVKIDEGKAVILADGAVYVAGNAKALIQSMSSDTNAFASTVARLDNIVRAR